MTKYTVAVHGEEGPNAQTTENVDDALDWFTNACTAVVDPGPDDPEVAFASFAVDGVIWGMVRAGGLDGDGGEVVQLRKAG